MDNDLYPENDELAAIESWDFNDFPALMAYIEPMIEHCGSFRKEGDKYQISTGGWSGNEDIICALQHNDMFWLTCWQSSRRGGHYVFEVKERAVDSAA